MAVTDATGVAVGTAEPRGSGLRRLANVTIVLALATVVGALGSALAPRLLGYEALAITSGSMGDVAPVGSLALTRHRLASEIGVGDVIALERAGHPIVVHRVLSIDTSDGTPSVKTKGDANPAPDAEPYALPVEVPVMSAAIPLVGYLVALLQIPLGWLLLVALPSTAVAAATIRDLWRTAEDEREAASPAAASLDELEPALAATRAELTALRVHAVQALTEMKRRMEAAEAETTALRAAVDARPADPPVPPAAEFERLLAEARSDASALRDRLGTVERRLGEALAPGPRLTELERLLDEAKLEIVSLRDSLSAALAARPGADAAVLERRAAEAEAEAAALRLRLAAAENLPGRASAAPQAAAEAHPGLEAHILFVPIASGYRLVERCCDLPDPGESVEVDGVRWVVTRVAPSPLPGDRRRCAYVAPPSGR